MLEVGQRIRGRVLRHEPFGAFVDIGESEPAALLMDALVDGAPALARKALPPVGAVIVAVFLGYGRPGGSQPRVSIRPSDLARVVDSEA